LPVKSGLKVGRLTIKGGWILAGLNVVEVAGMGCVAVKCIEMTRNTDCEGRLLRHD
jgi:hypothetical protein